MRASLLANATASLFLCSRSDAELSHGPKLYRPQLCGPEPLLPGSAACADTCCPAWKGGRGSGVRTAPRLPGTHFENQQGSQIQRLNASYYSLPAACAPASLVSINRQNSFERTPHRQAEVGLAMRPNGCRPWQARHLARSCGVCEDAYNRCLASITVITRSVTVKSLGSDG